MRSVMKCRRIKNLCLLSSVGIVATGISACSSGFERFDYQAAVPQQTAQAQNPYPGGVDPMTTAGTGSRMSPAYDVGPKQVPAGVYHNPEPTYAAPPSSYSTTQSSYQTQTSTSYSSGSVRSSTLPAIEQSLKSSATPNYTPPKPDTQSKTVYIPPASKVDSVKTASLSTKSSREQGWTATGGTSITIRQGETLYNLSKRYGVPVTAIRKANGLSTSSSIQAGQRIIIPTYVYGPNAGISAPDNNAKTRAASAGIGTVDQAKAASSSTTKTNSISVSTSLTSATDSAGRYIVKSGDSLSSIASRYGTTVAALQRANGLSGSAINVGQRLIVKPGIDQTTTASVEGAPAEVDPIVTGSAKASEPQTAREIASASTELETPQRTGISEFRWPVKGRVIEKFGESVAEGRNDGIDISVPEGTAVRAAENGVVIYTGDEISEYGNLVLVRHEDGWVSAYAHNRSFEVKKGDKINRGQIIARSGKTGNATTPKVHFELRKESKAVDPAKYLAGA